MTKLRDVNMAFGVTDLFLTTWLCLGCLLGIPVGKPETPLELIPHSTCAEFRHTNQAKRCPHIFRSGVTGVKPSKPRPRLR